MANYILPTQMCSVPPFLTSIKNSSTSDFSCFDIEYDLTAYNERYYSELGIFMPPGLARAVNKRKAEFLVGRYAAKQCLISLDKEVSENNFVIESGKHRAPIWPKGTLGSVSHTSSRVCVIVALNSKYSAIGLDVENWIEEEKFEMLKGQILTKSDERLIKTIQFADHKLGTLVFSAKESLFKALYPYVGGYFGFHAAEVQDICLSTAKIHLKLLRTLGKHPLIQVNQCFEIGFTIDEKDVFTKLLITSSLGIEQPMNT